jgi:hypothetical protein
MYKVTDILLATRMPLFFFNLCRIREKVRTVVTKEHTINACMKSQLKLTPDSYFMDLFNSGIGFLND